MKTILMILAIAGFAFGQEIIPSDYALPYRFDFKKDGRAGAQVFEQSPDDPNIVLVTRYALVDGQNPYLQAKETVKWTKADALAVVAQKRAAGRLAQSQESAALDAIDERYRQKAAAAAQRQRDAENASRIEDAVERGVEKALEQERNTRRK